MYIGGVLALCIQTQIKQNEGLKVIERQNEAYFCKLDQSSTRIEGVVHSAKSHGNNISHEDRQKRKTGREEREKDGERVSERERWRKAWVSVYSTVC